MKTSPETIASSAKVALPFTPRPPTTSFASAIATTVSPNRASPLTSRFSRTVSAARRSFVLWLGGGGGGGEFRAWPSLQTLSHSRLGGREDGDRARVLYRCARGEALATGSVSTTQCRRAGVESDRTLQNDPHSISPSRARHKGQASTQRPFSVLATLFSLLLADKALNPCRLDL